MERARTPEGCILPGLRPLSLAEIAEWWQILLISHYLDDNEIGRHDELFCAQLAANPPADVLELQKEPAGEPLGRFIGPLLPLAEDQSGSFLVADRRRGRRRGCLSLLDKVDGTLGAHSWDSWGRLGAAGGRSLRISRCRNTGRWHANRWTRSRGQGGVGPGISLDHSP